MWLIEDYRSCGNVWLVNVINYGYAFLRKNYDTVFSCDVMCMFDVCVCVCGGGGGGGGYRKSDINPDLILILMHEISAERLKRIIF